MDDTKHSHQTLKIKSMKIIHTSDWHLGQYFMGKSRQHEHQQFLSWLIKTAIEEKVEAIIVAGDVFDTGSPPSYARTLYNKFIVELQPTGIHLIILGGNHDSVATLGESKDLLACLNTHVIPGAMVDPENQVITLRDKDNETQAIVVAIPYLRPRDILYSQAGQSGSEKQKNLQQAISDHYQSIFTLAQTKQTETEKASGQKVPIIATGHLTTVGAKTSDSVRDIYIGNLTAFPSSAFPAADYIALGHIHRSQKVGGEDHIRYCGSPIPLSFDELNNDKNVLCVEFNDGQFIEAKPIKIPRFQAMQQLKGDLNALEKEIEELGSDLLEAHYLTGSEDEIQSVWLDIEVATEDYLNDLQQRINDMVDGLPVEVLVLRRARKQRAHSISADNKEILQELTPIDVFERRLAIENWEGEKQTAKKERIIEAFNTIVTEIQQESSPEDANIEAES